ncbi:hypothetical protein REPUB_Repub14bG0021200 [Reevesia pubescens]
MSLLPKSDSIQIREVWNDNLEQEFALIREIVDDYPYIATDIEFPGIVLRPVGNFKNNYDYHDQTLKDNDLFANNSIELLRQSGIDFKKNNQKGIDAMRFGELMMSSGIVLNDSVHWVTFHSGYDFGYLLKLDLPEFVRYASWSSRWIEQACRVARSGKSWDLS